MNNISKVRFSEKITSVFASVLALTYAPQVFGLVWQVQVCLVVYTNIYNNAGLVKVN